MSRTNRASSEGPGDWPRSLSTRQFRRGPLGVENAPKLHPRDVLVVLREEIPETRTDDPHEEPRGVPATDDPRMVRGGKEIQPVGFARRDIPRGDRLGVEVEQPRRVAEVLRLHISQGGPVGRRFGLLRFRLRDINTSRSAGGGFLVFRSSSRKRFSCSLIRG